MISAIELAYLPAHDQSALLDWLGYHAEIHRAIAEKALNDGHTDLGTYDVADMADKGDWAYFHYLEHQNIADTYNLSQPPDLSYWSEDEPDWSNWLYSHYLVHDEERISLGL